MQDLLSNVQTLFEHSGNVVSIFDEHDRLLYANPRYNELTGRQPGTYPLWQDLIRENYQRGSGLLIETDDIESWLKRAETKRHQVLYREFEVDATDGRWFLMTETRVPGVGLLCVGVETTRAKQTASVLQQEYLQALAAAETDPLTNMGNRRALGRLKGLLTAGELDREVAALMIDIDWFKPYNDQLGHIKGDECLQEVSEVILSSLRARDDYPFRIGGEEFLILMADTSVATASRVAERITMNMRARNVHHPQEDLPQLTLSIGVATDTINDEGSMQRLIQAADSALYKSKQKGRDQVTIKNNG